MAVVESTLVENQLFSDDEDVLPEMISQISAQLAQNSEIFRDVGNQELDQKPSAKSPFSTKEEEEENEDIAVVSKRKKRSRIVFDDEDEAIDEREEDKENQHVTKKLRLNDSEDEIVKEVNEQNGNPKSRKRLVVLNDEESEDEESKMFTETKTIEKLSVKSQAENSAEDVEMKDLSPQKMFDNDDEEKENNDLSYVSKDVEDKKKDSSEDIFARMGSDLFDAEESSEDEDRTKKNTTFDYEEDDDIHLSKKKAKAQNNKSKTKERVPKPEKKTKKLVKQLEDELTSIHGESQRIAREAKVKLPYYVPPKRSLEDFLNRPKLLIASRPPRDSEIGSYLKEDSFLANTSKNAKSLPALPSNPDLATLEMKMVQIEESISENLKKAEATMVDLQSQGIVSNLDNLPTSEPVESQPLNLFLEASEQILLPAQQLTDPLILGSTDPIPFGGDIQPILPNCLGISVDPTLHIDQTTLLPIQNNLDISQNSILPSAFPSADNLNLDIPVDNIPVAAPLLRTRDSLQEPVVLEVTQPLPSLPTSLPIPLASSLLLPNDQTLLESSPATVPSIHNHFEPLSGLDTSLDTSLNLKLPTFGKSHLDPCPIRPMAVSDAVLPLPILGDNLIQDLSEEANSAFPNKVATVAPSSFSLVETSTLDSNTQAGTTPTVPPTKQDSEFAQLKETVLKSVSTFCPKIEGSPNSTIDLCLDPDKVVEFKQRFLKHQMSLKQKPAIAKAVKLNIISKEVDEHGNDNLKQEELVIKKVVDAAPGTKLEVLKDELLKQVKEKKKLTRKEKQEQYNLENEQVEGEETDANEEELLDVDEEEAEFTDPDEMEEDTEEEKDEDLIENDILMDDDKEAPSNAFVDDEAEETEDEEALLGDDESESDEEVPSLPESPVKLDLSKTDSPLLKTSKSNLSLLDSSCDDLPAYQISKSRSELNDSIGSSKDSSLPSKNVRSPYNSQIYRPTQDKSHLSLSPLAATRSPISSLKPLSNLMDKSLNKDDSFELANICSNKFDSPQKPSIEEILKSSVATQESDVEEDLLGLCSANFSTQNIIQTGEETIKEDEDSDFEESILNKKKLKQRKLFQYSDEEEEDGDKEEEEIDEEEDENEEEEQEFDEEVVINEEEELLAPANSFFEQEAELSGSEASSDENEEDEDGYDAALIDDTEKFSETHLQKQIEKLHRKQLRDEEEQELRLLKERLIEDSDLYSDGPGRKRQFRWSTLPPAMLNGQDPREEDKSDGEEPQEDESWRIQRYEREKWLREKRENENEEEQMSDNSPFLKINLTNKRQIKLGPQGNNIQKAASAATRPGSFLARGKDFLCRLADKMKTESKNQDVSGQRSTKSFVFRPVSPPKNPTSTKPIPHKRPLINQPTKQETKKCKSIFDILEKC